MAKNNVKDWSATAANNTDVGGINIAENCPAANINNALREIMAQIAGEAVLNNETGQSVTGTFTLGGQATGSTHAVRADRSLTAGDGLSGGGNLTADRTLAVDSTVVRTTGNQTIGGTKTFSSILEVADYIRHSGDTDTYMRFSGADTWDVTTSGTTRVRADNSAFSILSNGLSVANGISEFNRNSDGTIIRFKRSGAEVGSVSVTSSGTSFNNTSDHRLKENLTPMSDAAERLKQIPVYRFNYIATPEQTVDGFIAHELQEHIPEAVTGKKDEEDENGTPIYQGVDQSKIVPLLVAALQDALARIEALES